MVFKVIMTIISIILSFTAVCIANNRECFRFIKKKDKQVIVCQIFTYLAELIVLVLFNYKSLYIEAYGTLSTVGWGIGTYLFEGVLALFVVMVETILVYICGGLIAEIVSDIFLRKYERND